MKELLEIINKNNAGLCMTCGKCSASCPVTNHDLGEYTSPRILVEKAISGQTEEFFNDSLFWTCLTCQKCSMICPSDVRFSEFIRDARSLAFDKGKAGQCTHGDVINTWGRMMTATDLCQNRRDWLDDSLEVSKDSDVIYFTGCLPYYDRFFKDLNFEGINIAKATVKILNRLGIRPQVMSDERCCGHDHLWEGDKKTFRGLANINIENFLDSGAKKIVTSCPECAHTLKIEYPKLVREHGLEVVHLSQLLAETEEFHKIDFRKNGNLSVTYQDPCRLGRQLNITKEPRSVLSALGIDIKEMEKNGKAALCCGTSCWTECGRTNKEIQAERLSQADDTGAELLVTACVKCQIHFKCSQKDRELNNGKNIKIQDLATLVADYL